MAVAPPQPGWGDVIREHAATDRTAQRLTEQLRACEAAALAFCRLLERWNRGEAVPATAGAREAALRHAADRVETAIAGLERAALALPARARAGARRGPLVVRRPGRGRARRVAPDPRSRRRARLPEPRRRRLPRARGARAGARRASPTRPASTARPTARRSGRACSTCATRCSARRSTTSARSPRSTRRGVRLQPRPQYASAVPAPRITVVGSVNLDLVVRCEELPRPGETVSGATLERFPGGKGANQAVACARLGARVTFVGAVGRTPSRTRRSPGCARQGSSSTCARPTSRPASR